MTTEFMIFFACMVGSTWCAYNVGRRRGQEDMLWYLNDQGIINVVEQEEDDE